MDRIIHSLNLKGAIKEQIQILMIATSKKAKKRAQGHLDFFELMAPSVSDEALDSVAKASLVLVL